MAGLAELRTAITSTVETVSGLRVYPTLAGSVALPACVIVPRMADFHEAMGRGLGRVDFELYLLVSVSGSRTGGQDGLDALLDPAGTSSTSVVRALLDDRSVGLSDTHVLPTGWEAYGARFEAAALDHIGTILKVEAHTRGT